MLGNCHLQPSEKIVSNDDEFICEMMLAGWVPRCPHSRLRKLTVKIEKSQMDLGRFCKEFATLLSNQPQITDLHIYNKGLHLTPVIAALCARKNSSLQHLTLTLGEVTGQNLSALRRLELQQGGLRTVSLLEGCNEGYPAMYANAIARILSSSAGTITSLELPAEGLKQVLEDLPTFPNLEVLHAWTNTITACSCLTTVQPNLRTLVWLMSDTYILDWAQELQSLAQRFPSLVELTIEVRDQSQLNERQLYSFGAHLIAHCPKLTNITLNTPEECATLGLDMKHRVAAEWGKYLRTLESITFKQGSKVDDCSAVLVRDEETTDVWL